MTDYNSIKWKCGAKLPIEFSSIAILIDMCVHTTELELDLILVSFPIAPPRFTRTPEDQIGVQGGVASFVCQAGGDPQPKIVWNKKGKKVSNQRFEVCRDSDVFFVMVLRMIKCCKLN